MRPKLFIAVAGLSLLLAIPVSVVLNSRDKIIQSQQRVNQDLQLQLNQLKNQPKPKVSLKTTKPAAKPSPVAVSKPIQTAPRITLASDTCTSYSNLFDQYSWNPSVAMAICQAESKGNPNALSPTCDRGLMQINCSHADLVGYDLSKLYNPSINIKVAYEVYSSSGWSAWSTYLSGNYLQYL